jgi:fumarate hydratase subunit beta
MKKIINLPTTKEQVKALKVGDCIYLSGIIYTARDAAHLRAIKLYENGEKLPIEFKGSAIFHCGPLMKRVNNTWEVIAAGPTTSARMNSLEPEFLKIFKPAFIIGKGGMSKEVRDAMRKYACAYLSFTGGAAVLAAKNITKVCNVYWYELGMPEALWILEIENFGPLIVTIDANGNSLYETLDLEVKKRFIALRKRF